MCFVCISVDKVTTDEELEEMLHRDNLAIFISDVSGISVLGHKNGYAVVNKTYCCFC